MAPLNPNAPFYFPCYYYTCYSSAPSPPPPPFPFYFDHSPSPPPFTATATAAAFFYSYSSLPNASANLQCYYEAPLYTVQSQVKTKQWMSMPAASGFEGREEPWLQFPIIDKYEQDHAVENYKVKESHAGFCYPNPKAVMKGGDNNSSSDLVSLRRVWIPKHRWQNRMFALPAADVFEFKDDDDVEDEDRTTVMMKNLPNKLLRNKLMEMLDEHCFQVNQKIKVDGGDGHDSILSEFDFLYLPMDFDSGSNLGYAFVNFTSAAAARRLYRAYQNKAWDTVLGSRKICEVTYARIQGLLPLQKRLKNSIFICDSDDYLPVYFTPSRNGDRHCQTEEHFIGRRVSRG